MNVRNKLESLSLTGLFLSNLMIVSKARSLHRSGAPVSYTSLTNMKLETNTLAYSKYTTITAVKSFRTMGLGPML